MTRLASRDHTSNCVDINSNQCDLYILICIQDLPHGLEAPLRSLLGPGLGVTCSLQSLTMHYINAKLYLSISTPVVIGHGYESRETSHAAYIAIGSNLHGEDDGVCLEI